jgi:twinkle protein
MQTNYDKLIALGIPLKRFTGQTKTLCPKCSHLRKNENKREPCLSVNIDLGSYTCHNNCGFQGNVSYEQRKPEKVYVRPVWQNVTALPDEVVKYWSSRGISQQTLIDKRISLGFEWMPQTQSQQWCLMFPYVRDGQLVNIKYRTATKQFKMTKDAELIFYNLDSIKDSEECAICEGEGDCLSFIEAGYLLTISVPNGASKGNNNMQYLDNCIDYFENKTKIYIGVDNDEPGRALAAELIRRLGAERCWIINYGDCKDGNEYLVKYGKLALAELITTARPAQISGIVDIEDVWSGVLDIWENGLQPGTLVNVKEIDDLISFPVGYLTLVVGKPNAGKGPFWRYIVTRLAVIHNWKIAIFAPEDEPIALHLTAIISLLTGKSFEKKYGSRITKEEIDEAKGFIQDHFFFISKTKKAGTKDWELKNFTVQDIIEVAQKLVFRHGINCIAIDPWNKIKHKKGEHFDEKNYISDQLDLLLDFAEMKRVKTFLVVHPTKLQKDKKTGKYPVVTLGDAAGAAEFETKPQMGISIYRDFDRNVTSMYVMKMKHRHHGKIGKVDFLYDWISGRFNVEGCLIDKGNWLKTQPDAQGYGQPSGDIVTVSNSGIPDEDPF